MCWPGEGGSGQPGQCVCVQNSGGVQEWQLAGVGHACGPCLGGRIGNIYTYMFHTWYKLHDYWRDIRPAGTEGTPPQIPPSSVTAGSEVKKVH